MKLFLKASVVERPIDDRREIVDSVLPHGFFMNYPMEIVQLKDILLTDQSVTEGWSIGNHYHTKTSGRIEVFIAIPPAQKRDEPPIPADLPLFTYRWRNQPSGTVQETQLLAGDIVRVTPETSHAFLPLVKGVILRGLANMAYDGTHDVMDKLF